MRKSLRAASRALLALAVVALVVATPGEALACPNCKSAVTDESSTGFAYAIYVMLASVFSLAGGVVWILSAGANGRIDTPYRAERLGGDDIGVAIK